ncbi:MAG: RAMP superfamily CRISPR-associated protein [Candidatus Cloacimonetes bacterium]|jgi:CRISPR-associated protein Csx10|nr:RAMP superfamily CRISPR-associated protein [Candidatus Cloacimonadota bacterium]MCB5288018.1 RAMP superfamily CRISPR-associated protein [Candidatus Cloacimonadota bacterium]MCK9185097.1 RAMP superfamily CRISPR-associated protein [Candidatus Cloacimonadota bacterium]MCK9583973.1 RAMP superfamily CRISPR-associated protein [Candidatus Cloacimonadota bacterium]MDY0230341.1 RAMP superfamily CRISPR-associated protein [Candidatus Cloacimonadaceae bacterium]
MNYTLKLSTLSDAIIGSAQSFGTIIDSDIVFDDRGLPYIPAKRIKGLFRNAAEDLVQAEGFREILNLDIENVFDTYGRMGNNDPQPPIIFGNLVLPEIDEVTAWLDYLSDKYDYGINQASIVDVFTDLRSQTAIDPETKTAKQHSLRSSRILRKGFSFEGTIALQADTEEARDFLAAICLFVDRIGSKRNRGFGKIKLELLDDKGLSLTSALAGKLEEKCKH